MAAYPLDPNHLFRELVGINERAATLREQGWTVVLHVTEGGSRVWLEVGTRRYCDPPPPAEAE